MREQIESALSELSRFNIGWKDNVKEQLDYCISVLDEQSSVENLEKLNIGLIAIREIDPREPLHKLLKLIQYEMQKQHLSYAAKVRLGIHAR